MQALRRIFSNYFKFSGRATRSELLWFLLFILVSFIVFFFVAFGIFYLMITYSQDFYYSHQDTLPYSLGLPFGTLIAIGNFAVLARRFHDLNLNGWWTIFFLLSIQPFTSWIKDSMFGLYVFINVISLVALILILCLRGTKGPNRYGQDPLAQ